MPSPSLESLLEQADVGAWDRLRDHYAARNSAISDPYQVDLVTRLEHNYAKYFDLETWLKYHLRHVLAMGLHTEQHPKRILDVGCGSGIFLFIAKVLGHDGIGMDVNSPMYMQMAACLGVDYLPDLVHPKTRLDARLTGFDWITAIAIKFDRGDFARPGAASWDLGEWQFFLADLKSRMNEGGRLYLKPNLFAPDRLFEDESITAYLTDIATKATPSFEFVIERDRLPEFQAS